MRFYRVWRPAFKKRAEPLRAPVLQMPPRPQPERPLPRVVEPAPIATKPLRFIPPRSILILESDLSIRKLLRRLLDRRGYFTHEVIEPEDLPAGLRERRVDLVIIEAALMGANGLDALAHVHPHLKILALSLESRNGAEVPTHCLTLTKPFSLDTFLDCVDRLLEPSAP
jgi:CheY-like chemotaxis protein